MRAARGARAAQMIVSTLSGSGSGSYQDGRGTAAHFYNPSGVACDDEGNVYVADRSNNRIRKVTPDGQVTTLAGSGSGSYQDGQGTAARFYNPRGVACDGEGNVYVADQSNHRIRKVTTDGQVTTLAGSGSDSYSDGQGTAAHFNSPRGVACDIYGNLIIADQTNHRIRLIAAGLTPPERAGALPKKIPSSYGQEMAAMLADDTFSDVTFSVTNDSITAHRAILAARCPYFKTMFSGAFKEGSSEQEPIKIGDTTPSAFRAILHYVYTDELQFKDADIIDVMRKAQEIELTRVYNHCVIHCRKKISAQNAIQWLVQADQHQLGDLRDSAFKYVARNMKAIKVQAKRTFELLRQHPDLLMEVMIEAI